MSPKHKSQNERNAEALSRAQRAEFHAQLEHALRDGHLPDNARIIMVRGPQASDVSAYQAALQQQGEMVNYYRHHANEAQQRLHETTKEIDRLNRANRPTSKFDAAGRGVGKLVEAKNLQYGDSANVSGNILKFLFPDGIPVEKYGEALLIVRVLDKLCRISKGDQGEESAWRDIAGYGILGMTNGHAKPPFPGNPVSGSDHGMDAYSYKGCCE